MKTCITAPEPIEADWYTGRGWLDRGNVFGAKCSMGSLLFVTDTGICLSKALFRNESPALLAFIQRAEAELLPKKNRTMGEVTRDDLEYLVYKATHSDWTSRAALVDDWADENNIQLPEGE